MKKTLCLIIAVVIALSSITVVSYAASPVFSMKADKTAAKVGDTVRVEVSVAADSNLCSATFDIMYDKECFEILKITATEALGAEINMNHPETNTARYVGVIEDKITDEELLFTVEFKVLKTGGKISLAAEEVYTSPNFWTIKEEVTDEVKESLKNVSVTVVCAHPEKETDIISEPTCKAEGSKVEQCAECGWKSEPIVIEKLPHDMQETVIKEATCTEAGKKAQKCKSCDYQAAETEIPATGHIEGEWKVVKKATKTETGLEQKKCTACKAVLDEREIPVLPEYKLGDVNEDGFITAVDARVILRCVAGLVELTPAQKLAADVTGDEEIGATDARMILQYVVGKVKF